MRRKFALVLAIAGLAAIPALALAHKFTMTSYTDHKVTVKVKAGDHNGNFTIDKISATGLHYNHSTDHNCHSHGRLRAVRFHGPLVVDSNHRFTAIEVNGTGLDSGEFDVKGKFFHHDQDVKGRASFTFGKTGCTTAKAKFNSTK